MVGVATVAIAWSLYAALLDSDSLTASYSPESGCKTTNPSTKRSGRLYAELVGNDVRFVGIVPGTPREHGANVAVIQPNGSIRAKVLWKRAHRSAHGTLRITGRRLDGGRGTLRVSSNGVSRASDSIPSWLYFSAPGCWQILAKSGRESARYVAMVEKRT